MNHFVDEVRIHIASGNGGQGCIAFRREKYIPKGGPNGGDGGRGGDVVFVVQRNLKTLTHLRNNGKYHAQVGQPGQGWLRSGLDGKDVIIQVPPGTRIVNSETGEVIMELMVDKETIVFLKGGKGGQGNSHFATSRIQAPRYAQPGLPGQSMEITIELNIIADIGFVGFPNAGKSSLLKALTHADPKIGAYPFTTKIPNLGVMQIHNQELVLADIPGIIEGAHEGHGLGLQFLKHISRTAGLAFLMDMSDGADHASMYQTLLDELEAYAPVLLERPRLIIATKMDLPESQEAVEQFKSVHKDLTVHCISAHTREGLVMLQQAFWNLARPGVQAL